ncbi:EAL domain-containing protein [Aestuariivirga sp.]|uniref:bifunctional diguanylate cyclase/phosphodiesterase n=1 Tax=Aestuariivirga sp. TaxID=2650926 RepID=UPI00391A63E0
MPPARSITTSFALKVLLPSIAAVSVIALLLIYLVNGIFEETNRLDTSYSEQLTTQAVSSLRDNLENLIFDNAVWDDAAENAGGKELNRQWIEDTWGSATGLGVYDGLFVTDALGGTLFAADDGKTNPSSAADRLGQDLGTLIVSARNNETGVASGLVFSGDKLHVVAAARIRWSSGPRAELPGPGNILIFSKTIDEDVLSGLAKRYVMEELRLVAPGETLEDGYISLRSPSANVVGKLTWKNRSPGDVVRDKFGSIVFLSLVLFLLMIAILLYVSWKGFREAHESQADAVAASRRDDLTGLANRREMIAALTQCLREARRSGKPLSVIYADLDGFKEVNDSYGHDVGDMLLKAAAAGFAYLARDAHLVARLGGDEFAIIVTDTGAGEQAREIARNMIAFLAEPMEFDGRMAAVSVSLGIVDLADDGADVEEIVRRADVAMYAAKTSGRNCCCVYGEGLDFKRDENRAIAAALRAHLQAGRLRLMYQPIVDARTGLTTGVEALVRWPEDAPQHYRPDAFIPVAEEFGLIEELGSFVLREACRAAVEWPGIFVAVNVSPVEFMKPGFAERVARTLREAGLDPARLELEVKEGSTLENTARANAVIKRLQEMKVRVALDDFGTGFSSIGHLRRLRFDKLKLDRSMVADILTQPAALRLVQGTIAMADALGLTVVAEGIEEENQIAVLRLAGCNAFQGHRFSHPLPAEEVPAWLARGPVAPREDHSSLPLTPADSKVAMPL